MWRLRVLYLFIAWTNAADCAGGGVMRLGFYPPCGITELSLDIAVVYFYVCGEKFGGVLGVLAESHCSVIPCLGGSGVGISRLVSRQAEISQGKPGGWDPQRAEKQALRKPGFAVRSAYGRQKQNIAPNS